MKGYVIALLGLVIASGAVKVTYENYKVYKVVPTSEDQVQILTDLSKQDGYNFWTEIINIDHDVRIMVDPNMDSEFLEYTNSIGLKPVVAIPNVQDAIDAQLRRAPSSTTTRNIGSFDWESYHTVEEIHAWLDELESLYPEVVKTVIIGQSNEGRNIKGVVIDFKPDERDSMPLAAMIEGGIHAREWISPATVTWVIKEFLTSTDAEVRTLAETFIWHIFPVVNPDGYSYTFTNNRMWRKNRNFSYNSTCGNNDDLSNGIDLNRNFDHQWMSIGASQNPCSETFAGPTGASEPETRAIASYVLTLKEYNNVIYYFAFHSFSQMILVPYSHVTGLDKLEAANYGDLYEVAIRGAEALEAVHGIPYTVGVSAEILYAVSGSSFDWVKGVADVPIVFLFELRDVGQFGFLLPPEQIIPNNEEIMACLLEMDRTTRRLGYYSGSSSMVYSSVVLMLSSLLFALYAK